LLLIMVKQISIEDALKENCVFVDVRSPGEFEEDHIPGAVNIYLLDDEQRAVVGTLYKKESPQKAFEVGYGMVSPRFEDIRKQLLSYGKKVVVYCWRGGMRSKAVTELAGEAEVYQLVDGYKKYREYVRECLTNYEIKPRVVVIHGYTCSGKTRILYELDNVVDLEGLAQHRGSVFGAMGLKPRSQKMFDSLLFKRLEELKEAPYIVFEGESNKIGDVFIPSRIYSAMKKGVHLLLEVPVEKRAQLAVDEYDIIQKKEEFLRIVNSLGKRLGKKTVMAVEEAVESGELVEAARLMLERYYDPLYDHTLDKYEYVKRVKGLEEIKEFLKSFK
jgi:tRNA 2-selenouridine synthase